MKRKLFGGTTGSSDVVRKIRGSPICRAVIRRKRLEDFGGTCFRRNHLIDRRSFQKIGGRLVEANQLLHPTPQPRSRAARFVQERASRVDIFNLACVEKR